MPFDHHAIRLRAESRIKPSVMLVLLGYAAACKSEDVPKLATELYAGFSWSIFKEDLNGTVLVSIIGHSVESKLLEVLSMVVSECLREARKAWEIDRAYEEFAPNRPPGL